MGSTAIIFGYCVLQSYLIRVALYNDKLMIGFTNHINFGVVPTFHGSFLIDIFGVHTCTLSWASRAQCSSRPLLLLLT